MRNLAKGLLLFGAAVLMMAASAFGGATPSLMNYQGQLADAGGNPLTGVYSMLFTIYDDPTLGGAPHIIWQETHPTVQVDEGLFSVTLGAGTPPQPLTEAVFSSPDRWLGIKVGGDPELSPRSRLSSVAYSQIVGTVDRARGGIISGSLVLQPDMKEGEKLTAPMISLLNAPDDTVLKLAPPLEQSYLIGDLRIDGFLRCEDTVSTSSALAAIQAKSVNPSSGASYGGHFTASPDGTGPHFGLFGDAVGGLGPVYGCYGRARHTGNNSAFGGYFETDVAGLAAHYGLYSQGLASSSAMTYGIYSLGQNSSNGLVYGGYFRADTPGSGAHFGVRGEALGNSSSTTVGVQGYGQNVSDGWTYGGLFTTAMDGTGIHHGIRAEGYGNSAADTRGVVGFADNLSSGPAIGGAFWTSSNGTGTHYGVEGEAYSNSAGQCTGVFGYASNTGSGVAYGGDFRAQPDGSGPRCGAYGQASSSTSSLAAGLYGDGTNSSTGYAFGGYFSTGNTGVGNHYGASGNGYATGENNAYGIWGYGSNTSSGAAYGGYFYTNTSGTGAKYGVYAQAPVGTGNFAGYFDGEVRITDSLIVLGGKSAAVKVDNGDYHLVYSQESPEVWFEDFGEASLVNGKTTVEIEPLFAQTVNTSVKYHVFLTPIDEPLTLAVAHKTASSFEVRGPTGSNISFSYRIVAKRKGFENVRLPMMGGPTPEAVKAQQISERAEMETQQAAAAQERQKTEEERAKMLENRAKPGELGR